LAAGLVIQVHLEGDVSGGGEGVGEGDRDWGLMPYAAGAVHYFPARSWSLDLGLRAGAAIGTRRLYGGVAQGQGAVALEYLGGLTWYI